MKNATANKAQTGKTAYRRGPTSFIKDPENLHKAVSPTTLAGARMRRVRESLGISRPNLSVHMSINLVSIKNYENGYRAADFDAIRNITEAFDEPARTEVIKFLVFGTALTRTTCPELKLSDLTAMGIPERRTELKDGFSDEDIPVRDFLKQLREEVYGLSRPKWAEKFAGEFPMTTIKNYERGSRRAGFLYIRAACQLAVDPVAAWKSICAASRRQKFDFTPWTTERALGQKTPSA